MAGVDLVFNIARGRSVQYYDNVENNNPANSAFIVVLLESSGLEADSTLRDYETLSALLAGTSNEPTGGTYARKTLTDANLAALPAPDDTNDRFDLDLPDVVFTNLSTTGNAAIAKLLVCYDGDTTSGTDANIVPLWAYNITLTPDGTTVTVQINAAGAWRSS